MQSSGTVLEQAKSELRRQFRERRDKPALKERRPLCGRMADFCAVFAEAHGWRRVAIYAHIGGEAETDQLDSALREVGCEVLYPRCDVGAGRLDFVAATPEALRPGALDIPEPAGEPTALDAIDAVLIPGLAFDRLGGRLGYGAGYYDRTLANYRGMRIGVAFAMQVVDRLPQLDHDVPMHFLLTENGFEKIALPPRVIEGGQR